MSIRFSIKNTADKAEREGNLIIRYSGTAEPFNRQSERYCKKVGVDGGGNPKLVFLTGLEESKVDYYIWFSDEEKEIVKEQIREMRPAIVRAYGGEEVIADTNKYFWKDDKTVSLLALEPHDIDIFYDTETPSHALLYLSIISGTFIDLVAPTKDWAEEKGVPHYLILEENVDYSDDIDVVRSDAHTALGDLRKNHGKEALYMLAWCLQADTKSFGAYNHNTTERDLITYHIQYIDGKLPAKKKLNFPRTFIEYYNKWLTPQTRKLVITEAYLKAGEYYNYINQREKKFVTADGTILGNTVNDAVNALAIKPKFSLDYEKLREQVEAKWKE